MTQKNSVSVRIVNPVHYFGSFSDMINAKYDDFTSDVRIP